MGYFNYKNIQTLKWDIEFRKCPEKQNGKFNF